MLQHMTTGSGARDSCHAHAVRRQHGKLATLAFLLLGNFMIAATCLADLGPLPIDGDIKLYFTSLYDGQGNHTGYRYDGSQGSLSVNANLPVVIPIGIRADMLGQSGLWWSDMRNWNGVALPLTHGANIVKAIINDAVGNVSISENWKAINALINGGPTEMTLSASLVEIDAPGFNGSFGAGIKEKFDVTLQSGADVLMDQNNVKLEKLTVSAGAKLTGNSTMVVRTDLVNNGFFGNLVGTVEGNVINDAGPLPAAGAVILGGLRVKGNLSNTGAVVLDTGGNLTVDGSITNSGTIWIQNGNVGSAAVSENSGTIRLSKGLISNFVNTGNFEWIGGSIYSSFYNTAVTNNGTVVLSGSDAKRIEGNNKLTNSGIVQQIGTSTLTLAGWVNTNDASIKRADLDNRLGGVYDLQGDGSILPATDVTGTARGLITNAGTFRKSAGTGESFVGGSGISFVNTGTIQVDTGTLTIYGGNWWGASSGSTDGVIAVASGARLKLQGSFNFQGANSISGGGVVELPSSGTLDMHTGTATLTGTTSFEISGGVMMSYGSSPGTLTTGSTSTVRMTSGTISGLSNGGAFNWMGGGIYYSGVTNSGNVVLSGADAKRIEGSSKLTNTGTVQQIGTASLALAGWVNTNNGSINRADLDNRLGGVYELQGDGGILPATDVTGTARGLITNAGTFRKSAGTGESVVGGSGISFVNTGTIQVDTGTLTIYGGNWWGASSSSTDGVIAVAAGARLKLQGSFNFQGANTIAGGGALELSSGGSFSLYTGTATLADASRFEVTGGVMTPYSSSRGTMLISPEAEGSMTSGSVGGLNNAGRFQWTGGSVNWGGVTNTGTLIVSSSGGQCIDRDATLKNSGIVQQVGTASLTMAGFYNSNNGSTYLANLVNQAGGVYELQGDGGILPATDVPGPARGQITNAGTFRKSGGAGESTIGASGIPFSNTGVVEVNSGVLRFNGTFSQTAGVTNLNGGDLAGTFTITGGLLTGSGTITGNVSSGGIVSPGHSPGQITLTGSYAQTSAGLLQVEIGGLLVGSDYDRLAVSGNASLAGKVEFDFIDGFAPDAGDTFDFMTIGGTKTGGFSTITITGLEPGFQYNVSYNSGIYRLTALNDGVAVPEPAGLGVLFTIACTLLACRPRQRRVTSLH